MKFGYCSNDLMRIAFFNKLSPIKLTIARLHVKDDSDHAFPFGRDSIV
jgi:hypothetical protein